MTCCECDGIERQFGQEIASKELERFRRKGPIPTTRLLIEDLRTAGIDNGSLLDIGGGVGALHHILLDGDVSKATHVDVSSAYLEVAQSEAARRGHAAAVLFIRGDFVELASALPDADIVALDRVICCYPDMESLVGHAADKARRVFAAVYPRGVWWMRLSIAIMNSVKRLRGSEFRSYLHPPLAIGALLTARGLERATVRRTFAWEIAVYRRREAS